MGCHRDLEDTSKFVQSAGQIMDTATKVDTVLNNQPYKKRYFTLAMILLKFGLKEIMQTENPLRKYTMTSTHPQRDNGPSEIFLRNKREIHDSVRKYINGCSLCVGC